MFWEGALDNGRGCLFTVDAFVCLRYACAFYGSLGSILEVARKKSRDLKNVACICRVITNLLLCGGLNRQIKIIESLIGCSLSNYITVSALMKNLAM